MKAFDIVTSLGAVLFGICNSYLQIQYLIYETYSQSIFFIASGFLIFLFGFIVNIHSDQILINLNNSKKNEDEVVIDGKYRIPFGGFFYFISAANYWGELTEWLGMWICLQNCASFGFFFTTASNLGTRSISVHKWYKEKFGDKIYPKNRKAIIPFIY
jgi:3-oxo-5-alpha-steroid 4-dehydrogenase 1